MGCTIFTASYGNKVLFCKNEDWNDPNYNYYVIPSSKGGYGWIYFSFAKDFPCCCINEKGLCIDHNLVSEALLKPNFDFSVFIPYSIYYKVIMSRYSTVDEIIEYVNNSYSGEPVYNQAHFADATGVAVVVSLGRDGKLAFTRKERGDGYLLSTNFNLANPEDRVGEYPCWRYDKATAMLKEIKNEDELTIDKCSSILDAVHQEGDYPTVYSGIFDLKNAIIYLYHLHKFDKVTKLNLSNILAKGECSGGISEL